MRELLEPPALPPADYRLGGAERVVSLRIFPDRTAAYAEPPPATPSLFDKIEGRETQWVRQHRCRNSGRFLAAPAREIADSAQKQCFR